MDEMQAFALERSSTFVIDKVSFFCDKNAQEWLLYDENEKALFFAEKLLIPDSPINPKKKIQNIKKFKDRIIDFQKTHNIDPD